MQSSAQKDSHPVGLTRFASAGSAQKESNPVGMSRSGSMGSAQKNTTPIPFNSTAQQVELPRSASASSATKAHPGERDFQNKERQRLSSNTKPKKNNKSQETRSPTLSDVESPDDFEAAANNAGNDRGHDKERRSQQRHSREKPTEPARKTKKNDNHVNN
jgi:hypothetical protein